MRYTTFLSIILLMVLCLQKTSDTRGSEDPDIFYTRGDCMIKVVKQPNYTVEQIDSILCAANRNLLIAKERITYLNPK
jgi:hypothetical protein